MWQFIVGIVLLLAVTSFGFVKQLQENGRIQEKLEVAKQERAAQEKRDERIEKALRENRRDVQKYQRNLADQIGALASAQDDGCLDRDVPASVDGVSTGELQRVEGEANRAGIAASGSNAPRSANSARVVRADISGVSH